MLVLGLGITGEAVARHLQTDGNHVTVVEDAPGSAEYERRAGELRSAGVEIRERPSADDLANLVARSDLLIPSPGVREGHPAIVAALAAGVPVRPEIEVAAELAAERGRVIVAVTGTNGKTTVTSLIVAMLEQSGVTALAAGNIGLALIDAVDRDASVLVVEVSSFQLLFTSSVFRPHVAVLLNIAHDHLDWHGSLDRYAAAKARIFASQLPADLVVFNADDERVRALVMDAPARQIGFSTARAAGSFHEVDGRLVDASERVVASLPKGRLLPHDVANAAAAAAAAIEVGASRDGIERALDEYRRLPHRVALVGEASGVRYFDDSKATNPHATLAALDAFREPVVLIAGGLNKNLDLDVLTSTSAQLRAVVAIGDAASEIERAFVRTCPVTRAASMHDAVQAAAARAQSGDVVLLSPACASFDWYESYAARGDDFAREVEGLVREGAAR